MRSVHFLARAYNDIDCRLPLLLEFAQDANYCVKIVAIPTNAGLQDPKLHELHEFMVKHGITVTTIYGLVNIGLPLRIMFWLYEQFSTDMAKFKLSYRLNHFLTSAIFRALRWLSIKNRHFIPEILEELESSIVVMDEIIFHAGRSFFVDALRADWKKNHAFELCAFLTGQDPYLELWKDETWVEVHAHANASVGVPLFVPGPNDELVMNAQLPNEDIVVVGNTRFDKSWVALRCELSQEGAARVARKFEARPGTHKIVFMLSKLEYGVEVSELVATINMCAAQDNATVIVKPHTRGMEFGVLGPTVCPRVADGSAYSSSDLIEWADFVLFTGSSVAFHALLSGKKVIYLKYCQRYKSIYDTGEAMIVADNILHVLQYINSPNAFYCDEKGMLNFLASHIYNGNDSGMVCHDIKVRIERQFNLTAETIHARH